MIDNPDQQPQLQTQELAFVQHVQPVRGDLPPAMRDYIPSLVDSFNRIDWVAMTNQMFRGIKDFDFSEPGFPETKQTIDSMLSVESNAKEGLEDEVDFEEKKAKCEFDESIEIMNSQRDMAEACMVAENYVQAIEHWEKAEDICNKLGWVVAAADFMSLRASCWVSMATNCVDCGNFAQAVEYSEKAVNLCAQAKEHEKEVVFSKLMATCLCVVAKQCFIEGNRAKTVEYCKKAAKTYNLIGMREKEMMCLATEADALEREAIDCGLRRNFIDAAEHLKQAIEIFEQLGMSEDIKKQKLDALAVYLEGAAFSCIEKGKIAETMGYFKDCVALFETSEEKAKCLEVAVAAFINKAKEYRDVGEYVKAMECYKDAQIFYALSKKTESNTKCLRAAANFFIGKAKEHIGVGKYTEAMEYYDNASILFDGLGSKKEKIEMLEKAADCFCDAAKGYASKGNSLKAKECYGKAAALYKKLGNIQEAKKCLKHVSEKLNPSASQSKVKTTESGKKRKGRG